MHLTSLAKDEEETLEFEDEDFKALTKTDSLKEFIEEVESLSYRIMSSTGKMESKCMHNYIKDFFYSMSSRLLASYRKP